MKYFRAALLACSLFLPVSSHAIQYSITDLGTLGGIGSRAYGINDAGQIVGWGVIDGGKRAFLLNAVLIPPALYLFGSGLIGLVGMARRRALATS